jgi:hypothetical protein
MLETPATVTLIDPQNCLVSFILDRPKLGWINEDNFE